MNLHQLTPEHLFGQLHEYDFSTYIKRLIESGTEDRYRQFRQQVYQTCKNRNPGYSSAQRVLTGKVTARVYVDYFRRHNTRFLKSDWERFCDSLPPYVETDLGSWVPPFPEPYATGGIYKMDIANFPLQFNFTVQENNMQTNQPIETITFIYGTPLDKVSDDQVYEALTKLNAEIEKLKTLSVRTKAMDARLDALKKAENEIVAAIDERDEKLKKAA